MTGHESPNIGRRINSAELSRYRYRLVAMVLHSTLISVYIGAVPPLICQSIFPKLARSVVAASRLAYLIGSTGDSMYILSWSIGVGARKVIACPQMLTKKERRDHKPPQ